MDGYTKLITVGTTAVAITAQTYTDAITVGEDASVVGYPTTAFSVMKPASTNDPERIVVQGRYTFTKSGQGMAAFYGPGEIAGYVKTVTGSTTFFQDEA